MEILATFIALALLLGFAYAVMKEYSFAPREDDSGDFVAEVWLEWEICSGSTLYRRRFSDPVDAEHAVRKAAKALDDILPTHYRVEGYYGRTEWEKHGFSIRFGVRDIQESEKAHFRGIWSPHLPGESSFSGEHASAHPMLQGSLSGYKV